MKKRFFCLLTAATFIICCMASCGNKSDSVSSAQEEIISEEQINSEEVSSVDTRYRATREQKPDNFKYKNVKILTIGDSITQGNGTPSGYRYQLYEYLYSHGATFSLVGLSRSSSDYRLPERYQYHCGTGGYKIADIMDNIDKYLAVEHDIITLMIGRNDQNDTTDIANRYKALLEKIFEIEPDAIVYCSEVVPKKGESGDNAINTLLNKNLPDICSELQAAGKQAHFVGMKTSEWNSDCFPENDTVHPNETGNKIIGECFGDAMLDQILQINDEGDDSYTLPTRVSGISLNQTSLDIYMQQSVTLKSTITPSDAEVFTVIWTSSDPTVARVSDSGRVTGLKKGTATVTAKSLDGGFTAECTVNVSKDPDADKYTEVMNDSFADSSIWKGNTDKIAKGKFSTLWASGAYTVTSVNEYDAGNHYIVSMKYQVNGNESGDWKNNYSSLKFGDFELKIYNCVRKIELLQNGSVLGTYEGNLYTQPAIYSIKYNDGKVSAISSGETIITAEAKSDVTKSPVIITAAENGRCVNVTNVTIKKI